MHVPNRASLQQFWESLVWSQQSSLLVSVVSKLFRHLSTIVELVVCFSILSTPPLGRASSAPYSWVLAPSHKTCFLTKKKLLGRFSEDSQKTQEIVSRLRLLKPLTRRIGRFEFWCFCFFLTRFVPLSIVFFFCVWEWRRREGNEGGGGEGRRGSGFGGLCQVHCSIFLGILPFHTVLWHFWTFLRPCHKLW